MKRERGAISLVVGVLLVVAASAPAFADYSGRIKMDDSTMDFYYASNLSADRKTGAENLRKYAVEATDISTVVKSAYYSYVDAWVIQASPSCPPYGTITSCEANRLTDPFYTAPSAYAITTCLTKLSNRKCDQSRVAFNSQVSHSNYRAVACHEFGHVIGFEDGENATYATNSTETNAEHQSCLRS